MSGTADFKSLPGFENWPRFVGVIKQNKICKTLCQYCILTFVNLDKCPPETPLVVMSLIPDITRESILDLLFWQMILKLSKVASF